MTCDQFNEIHQVYLDGLLKKLPRAAESHTKKCTVCASKLRGFDALHEEFAELQAPELSSQGENWLKRQIQHGIDQPQKSTLSVPFGRLRWARFAALGTAVALVGLVLFSTLQMEETAPEPMLVEEELEIFFEEHLSQQQRHMFHSNILAEPTVITASVSRRDN